MKKMLRETQTLHAGCSKAQLKVLAPPQTPFPGVQDGQNLISWRWSLSLPINTVWRRSMHAISSYRGNRPTNKPTNRQDRLQFTIHCTAVLSVQCSNVVDSIVQGFGAYQGTKLPWSNFGQIPFMLPPVTDRGMVCVMP